jgi:hypothetical protein
MEVKPRYKKGFEKEDLSNLTILNKTAFVNTPNIFLGRNNSGGM